MHRATGPTIFLDRSSCLLSRRSIPFGWPDPTKEREGGTSRTGFTPRDTPYQTQLCFVYLKSPPGQCMAWRVQMWKMGVGRLEFGQVPYIDSNPAWS